MKICKSCKRELDESCFYRNKRMKDGLQIYCKECFDEMLKATKAKHKKLLLLLEITKITAKIGLSILCIQYILIHN